MKWWIGYSTGKLQALGKEAQRKKKVKQAFFISIIPLKVMRSPTQNSYTNY
ncbi:MAG TPA: hypothetical protein VF487_18975 [Chitinophagaceae bacterium]